jgi:biopolymer transport protein TolR
MAFGKLGHDKGFESVSDDLAEINIIPLVDVMLVLLIIFMVTAPLSIGGIKVELPHAAAKSTGIDENRVVLSINAGGDYYLDRVQVPANALTERFKVLYENRDKKELYIRADREVSYGKVVEAMSAAKGAGVLKIGMLTQAQNK